jgi:glutathionylspermidine synthase
MQRHVCAPRANLPARIEETGFTFATIDGEPYWDERAFYAFSLAQIEADLEDPSTELYRLCLEAAGRIIADDALLRRLDVPARAWPLIRRSWERREPSLYGRFDFSYDGYGPAKLLEFNADTPTALFEAAVFQWQWLEDQIAAGVLADGCDQFNGLHEALIDRLRAVAAGVTAGPLHLAADTRSGEDAGLIAYLADCALQAGLQPQTLDLTQIGRRDDGPFVDLAHRPIHVVFKLYPWEWMFQDAFAATPSMQATRFIEPPWKAVLSNKGLLPILWELAPGHPNLLETWFEDDPRAARLGDRYVQKPLLSREGSGVRIVDGLWSIGSTAGPYGCGRFIRQAEAPLPVFDGQYPVIGSWIIGDRACGIGIREDTTAITKNTSRFIPHVILPSAT